MFPELSLNEFNDMKKNGWLVEGTVGDVGKFKLSAKGLEAYARLLESASAKDQALIKFSVAANAFKTPAEIQAFFG